MARIWAIAINTFREAVRDRVLHGVLGFASVILLFSLALGQLSLDQDRRVVHDVGFASLSLFSVVVAVFLGSSLLYKEIERKTLYVILPKPIRRYEFLMGKYLGIALTACVFIAVMGAVQLWVAAVQAGGPIWATAAVPCTLVVLLSVALWRASDRTAVVVPWSLAALVGCTGVAAASGVALAPAVAALLLAFAEVLVVAAVALLFSSFSTPFLTGVFSMGVWLVGRSADDMVQIKSELLGPEVKGLLRGLAWVVPNLNLFVPGRHLLETAAGPLGPFPYVATCTGYAVLYSAVLLVAASVVFSRRDFL